MMSKNPVTKREHSLTRSRVGDSWIGQGKFGRTSNSQIQHTSSQSIVTRNASTAVLTAPRMLRTSNQHKNFFSRNWRRAEVIVSVWSGAVCVVAARCVCHEIHAYCRARSMYCSVLSFMSLTSSFATASGSLQMFFSSF